MFTTEQIDGKWQCVYWLDATPIRGAVKPTFVEAHTDMMRTVADTIMERDAWAGALALGYKR